MGEKEEGQISNKKSVEDEANSNVFSPAAF